MRPKAGTEKKKQGEAGRGREAQTRQRKTGRDREKSKTKIREVVRPFWIGGESLKGHLMVYSMIKYHRRWIQHHVIPTTTMESMSALSLPAKKDLLRRSDVTDKNAF